MGRLGELRESFGPKRRKRERLKNGPEVAPQPVWHFLEFYNLQKNRRERKEKKGKRGKLKEEGKIAKQNKVY